MSRLWTRCLFSGIVLVSLLVFSKDSIFEVARRHTANWQLGNQSETTASDAPYKQAKGIPDDLNNTSAKTKAIVATILRNDLQAADWIVDLLPDWDPHIYIADAGVDDLPIPYQKSVQKSALAINKGREASTYLTYITTHYYDLPDYVVFVHGQRYQTHNGT